MDKLVLKGLQFRGCHGCLDSERSFGQWFEVDLEIFQEQFSPSNLDQLDEVLDYTRVIDKVQSIVEGEPFKLMESLAEHIASKLFEAFLQVKAVRILLKKTQAPIAVTHTFCGVEIYRER